MDKTPNGNKPKFLEVFYAYETGDRNNCSIVVLTSFLLFNINALLILPRVAPLSAKKTPEQLWKWRNIANSLIHSILSGVVAMFNLLNTPELRHELINTYNLLSFSTLSFSVGYFIYDFVDMASHHRRTSTYELLVHHTLVVICFSLALVTKFYQGTFVVFRLFNLIWMICWLALNQSGVNAGVATVTYTAFAQLFFLLHSLKLFKKILIADGFMSGKGPHTSSDF